MTDKPTITQPDRDAAWFIRPDCFSKEEYANWRLGVYDASACIQALAKHRESSVAELQAEVERLNNAIEKICIESNSDWAKVRDEPRAQIDVIHNIAIDAFFYKHALAQKEPVK